MRESAIEKKLVRIVREKGGKCVKFTSPGTRGVPDRIAIMPNGVVWFIELKREGEKLRPDQEIWRKIIEGYGCNYMLYTGKEALPF